MGIRSSIRIKEVYKLAKAGISRSRFIIILKIQKRQFRITIHTIKIIIILIIIRIIIILIAIIITIKIEIMIIIITTTKIAAATPNVPNSQTVNLENSKN